MSFMVDGMELIMLGGVALIAWYLGFRLPEPPPPAPPPLEPYPWQPAPPTPPALAIDSAECKRLYDAYVAFRRSGDSTAAYMVREDARGKGCKWANGGTPVRLPGGLAGAAGTALGASPAVGGTGTPTAPATAPTSAGGGGTSGGARLIL